MRMLLAAVVACLVLTTIAAAQEDPGAEDERTARLFDLGMTALEIAERTDGEADAERTLRQGDRGFPRRSW